MPSEDSTPRCQLPQNLGFLAALSGQRADFSRVPSIVRLAIPLVLCGPFRPTFFATIPRALRPEEPTGDNDRCLEGSKGVEMASQQSLGSPAKITALIPAGNEAHQIAEAIRSVLWSDEVFVVVDSASTDGTAEVARTSALGVRVESHEYGYSAAQKNWAIPRASHPWIFLLDANERVTPELQEEIRGLMARGPEKDAYQVRRKNLYLDRVMRHGGWQTDKVIRLFKRECRYSDRRVHAEIEGCGSLGELENAILHDTFRDWPSYLLKLERYTTWGAQQDFQDGKRAGFGNVVLRPIGRFLKQYVIRLGFFYGIPGAIAAFLGVYGVFLKYAKLWDMRRKEPKSQRAHEPRKD